ncbi:putative homing endonuclease [Delftia phage PhiW-14]|uniref:Putative homing endonuclease n=1 Tax=Delftia phage PhiW-14 TaxID=665032 RepID=C9DG44_BPW14|nr:homing endonuclease [Delftia phage PhiW-14]ACV50095.1 putative homing endonuclease [Delftia phage PhiW-14]
MQVKSILYVQRYEQFIKTRRPSQGPVERHHIIPLSCGGTNDPSNLVTLSLREHYIAHWMLMRAYDSNSLRYAFMMMTNRTGRRRSKDYELSRRTVAEEMRAKQMSKPKEMLVAQGKKLSDWYWGGGVDIQRHSERSSIKMKELNATRPEFKAKRVEALREVQNTKEYKDKLHLAQWTRYKDKWIQAGDFYDNWVAAGSPKGTTDFCKSQGYSSTHWNKWQSLHKKFVEQGWNPWLDELWLAWVKEQTEQV